MMWKDQIQQSLEQYGRALGAGDFSLIANGWAVPAIVLSDSGALVVSDMEQIERFFAGAVEWYRAQGIVSTVPRILRTDVLSERLVSVDVHWPSYDAEGSERMSEVSHYILELGQDELFRIRVALTRSSIPRED